MARSKSVAARWIGRAFLLAALLRLTDRNFLDLHFGHMVGRSLRGPAPMTRKRAKRNGRSRFLRERPSRRSSQPGESESAASSTSHSLTSTRASTIIVALSSGSMRSAVSRHLLGLAVAILK